MDSGWRLSRGQLAFACIAAFLYSSLAGAETIGVCYGRVADNLPPPEQVVSLLKSNNIAKMRMFDANPSVLQAFANSGIELMTAVPNEQLQIIASSPEAALEWIEANIEPFAATTLIKYIAVGNEIFLNNPQYGAYVVPAMQNMQSALAAKNMAGAIKVSSPHAASVLGNSFPPSQGAFQSDIVDTMRPLLDFLAQTGAPFMANIYPFFSYINNPQDISLPYALFTSPPSFVDNGLSYSNLFDATVDALISAMEALGHSDIAVAVTETGWPWAGGSTDAESPDNAMTYNSNLIRHVLSDAGTPKRPGVGIETFLFGLFNEDQKPGEPFERDFGLFYPTGQKVYDINFSPQLF
eukprot:Gb_40154 [translate_table: standard]